MSSFGLKSEHDQLRLPKRDPKPCRVREGRVVFIGEDAGSEPAMFPDVCDEILLSVIECSLRGGEGGSHVLTHALAYTASISLRARGPLSPTACIWLQQ